MQISPCRDGNNGATDLKFENLVERYYRPLYQFALSLSGSEADGCDLTQHTFYAWSKKGEQLRDPSKVKAWLFTTLHRAFLQTWRSKTRFPHYELDEVGSELPWTSPEAGNSLDSADVLAALAKLAPVFRAPLALFYLQDCPYKDIALILDVPLGTVKSRIARGIVQLQRLLIPAEYSQQAAAG